MLGTTTCSSSPQHNQCIIILLLYTIYLYVVVIYYTLCCIPYSRLLSQGEKIRQNAEFQVFAGFKVLSLSMQSFNHFNTRTLYTCSDNPRGKHVRLWRLTKGVLRSSLPCLQGHSAWKAAIGEELECVREQTLQRRHNRWPPEDVSLHLYIYTRKDVV